MTNYNDGRWHGWNGGDCPVHPKSIVLFQTINGVVGSADEDHYAASNVEWGHDIGGQSVIAFRVVKEYRQPREFWAHEVPDLMGGLPRWIECKRQEGYSPVLFREVLE